MKKLAYLILALIMTSCGLSPEEKLIKDVVESFGDNAKVDVDFSPKKTTLIKTITVADSLNYFLEDVELGVDTATFFQNMDNQIASLDSLANYANEQYRLAIDQGLNLPALLRTAKEYSKQSKDLSAYMDLMRPYATADRNKVLGYVYQCQYTAKDIIFNSGKIEYTADFFINADKTKATRVKDPD